MMTSFRRQVDAATEMLQEYEHLINADQIDCSVYFPSGRSARVDKSEEDEDELDFGAGSNSPSYAQCWLRKYGATLFSLAGFAIIGSIVFFLVMREFK